MISENEIRHLVEACKPLLGEQGDLDSVLKYLKAQTGKKTVSIVVLAQLLNISLDEAKILVHESDAWQDTRQRDEKIEENVVAAIQKIEGEI